MLSTLIWLLLRTEYPEVVASKPVEHLTSNYSDPSLNQQYSFYNSFLLLLIQTGFINFKIVTWISVSKLYLFFLQTIKQKMAVERTLYTYSALLSVALMHCCCHWLFPTIFSSFCILVSSSQDMRKTCRERNQGHIFFIFFSQTSSEAISVSDDT